MKANNFSWYINRLFAMSPNEIIHRIISFINKRKWKHFPPVFKLNYDLNKIELSSSLKPISEIQAKEILEEADKYLDHTWLFFGLDITERHIDWHKDPVSNISAPLIFGFDINHRNEKLVGNIKNTWEKNRHHHLTILAEAYYITKDEKYAEEVKNQLISWLDANPYLIGVNWTHPLEQGVRLIAWVYIFKFLHQSKYFDDIFGQNGFLWKSVYEHQKFIAQTYSKGSSANNHVIGEMAGLYISSSTWPIFSESSKWEQFSRNILEKETLHQTFDDGINKELAFSYQIFVFEFCLLAYIENPDSFSSKYISILLKMISAMFDLYSILGFVPSYGDGDEGRAVQFQAINGHRLNWLFDLSNIYLKCDFPFSDSLESQFFAKKSNSSRQSSKPKDVFFSKKAGLLALKANSLNKKLSCLIDFGPLGLDPMAAHGHADSLSFVLAINGQPVFIDPGTFAYHTDLKWRQYFRSVQAHNTISVNNKDQSEQIGPFLWGQKANTQLTYINESNTEITASHDGYCKIGIRHERNFVLSKSGLVINDNLFGSKPCLIELRFHIHPLFSAHIKNNIIQIDGNDSTLELHYNQKLSAKILNGSNNGGWFSTKFGIKEPCDTIVLNGQLYLPEKIETFIEVI